MYSHMSNIRVIWFNVYLLSIEFFNWKKVHFGTCPVSRFVSVPSVLPESDLLCVLQMIRRLLRNTDILYKHIFRHPRNLEDVPLSIYIWTHSNDD